MACLPPKVAIERKHPPLTDVATAGGWKDKTTLLEVYQQADEASVLAVTSETCKLRERGVREKLDPNSTTQTGRKNATAGNRCGVIT